MYIIINKLVLFLCYRRDYALLFFIPLIKYAYSCYIVIFKRLKKLENKLLLLLQLVIYEASFVY
jgi:hypothetical protein